jgi:hypothetical protein
LAIVVFSAILKVPQILKILKAKSAEGLSYTSFLMEVKTYHKTSLPLWGKINILYMKSEMEGERYKK